MDKNGAHKNKAWYKGVQRGAGSHTAESCQNENKEKGAVQDKKIKRPVSRYNEIEQTQHIEWQNPPFVMCVVGLKGVCSTVGYGNQ